MQKPGGLVVKKFLCMLVVFLASGFAHATLAASAGVIDGVQMPAWLDRGGLTVPVSPGLSLRPGDTLRTGGGARLLLKLDEGSVVKLGENAKFVIEKAQPAKGGAYEAALNVVSGAFRFTTEALSRSTPRDVTITVGQNATIGVRGTDLWGRGREDKDIVCLIEGRIEITGNDKKRQTLDKPLQLFQSTRTAPPEPLTYVSKEQLAALALETEIEIGKGSSTGGGWKVVIDGFTSREAAREAARNLRVSGYPAEVTPENTVNIAKMNSELTAGLLGAQLKIGSSYKEVRIAR